MASTPLGDIPGARFHIAEAVLAASVASNGATARLGQLGPFEHNVRIRAAYWSPTGGIQNSAAASASYRSLNLYHGGAAGTASASAIASRNLTMSIAQYSTVALAVDTAVTLSAGHLVWLLQGSAGAANDEATVLRAGQLSVNYEII